MKKQVYMFVINAVGDALVAAGSMGWEILWPLILGFTLSGIIQAVVRTDQITKLMRDDSPRAISVATGLGALSSSCSYAAVALARALFRKGASLSSAMAFEVASTNLVVELGLILAFVMGWQFTAAEFVGGPLMIILIALGFRLWMRGKIVDAAREQADKGLAGAMEGHAAMDMSVQGDQGFWRRLFSRPGLTSVSQYFVMDWASVIRDIVIGLLIAGAFDAWVPKAWLQALFLEGHPTLAFLIDPLIGPILAMVSFVCSVGNVPLAAVLWNGGISFGGVISFIFADLIIIPIIIIYRKYYGWKAALRITGIFYGAMVLAGYAVELLFTPLHLIPTNRHLTIVTTSISWNYTTWLNIVFLLVAAFLLVVFTRSGSWPMLRMMSDHPDTHDQANAKHSQP
ncbi:MULTISPECIES: permease [Curtobacterium]|uniref:permease n=1 Tax=Curtobacterium TaxID=2034 RepID=UPI00190FB978|nr:MULTISPECIES: permease [Curtobacterium]MBT1631666.1 permease [Curtobacterium flaccumfaciens pv. oortii]MCX2844179.1 permease [Curtobacterium flaccumfaciens pv. oortii]